EYRQHLAECSACLRDLGGEREIERIATTVVQAREGEIWEPDLHGSVASRLEARKKFWRFSLSFLSVCLAVSFLVHIVIVSGVARLTPTLADPITIAGVRITLDHRPTATPKAAPPTPQRRLTIVHNVVQMSRAPIAPVVPPDVHIAKTDPKKPQPQEISTVTVHPRVVEPSGGDSNVPIWRRGGGPDAWRAMTTTTTTAYSGSAPQAAERITPIQINAAYTTREPAPIGGETALSPKPAMIAYEEVPEGTWTSVFEVTIDERGNPTKCSITSTSGYPVLDDAVCKAAMGARYTPKSVNGRAVNGTYRDAFTWRMSDNMTIRSEINN
ncbi:MAG: TonB family protein, partial [Vulcanimicrobiaceae bacterium]